MSPGIFEFLANLSIATIMWIMVVATGFRLGLIRSKSPAARSVAEFLESGIIAVALVWMLIRPFLVQAYFIPSASMEPTLIGKNGDGDRILVNKMQYRLQNHGPAHGDVVVFIPPALATKDEANPSGGPINYIKRLIGLPGDRIQTVAGRVIVNGTPFDHETVRDKLSIAGIFGNGANIGPSLQDDHHVKFTEQGVMADGKLVPNAKLGAILTGIPGVSVRVQPGYVIRNGQRLNEPYTAEDPDYDLKIYQGMPLKSPGAYSLYQLRSDHPLTQAQYETGNAAPTEPIPPGTYFMMGDNRNDSKDGTEWGPLDKNRVIGHAQFVFWPLNRVGTIH